MYTDPSASDLISIFLHQAEIAVNTAREIAQKEQMQNSELKGEAEPIQTLGMCTLFLVLILQISIFMPLCWDCAYIIPLQQSVLNHERIL